ncbi:P-loop NTPase fold protein [Acinetobacter sp. ANC 4639]
MMIQPPISEENKHIEEYLVDYFERPDTEYAVMINGPWGTGKTWFIKKIIETYNSGERKKFYISLNGMAKIAAIDAELFRIMHPILGSKTTKFLGKIAASTLKATIKVDLVGDNEQETLNLGIPTLNISDLVEPGKETTIIFDDLERCQIPIKEVLGYINYFVEHQNLKIIIISDESKIEDKEYLNIKEKLIGTTFFLEGSYETAIDAFLEEKSLNKIKDKLIQNKEIIYEVYDRSGFKNLRSIKQALQEFSRFYDENYFNGQKGSELFIRVLKYFLIFSLEVRAGTFQKLILEFKEDAENEDEKEYGSLVLKKLQNKSRNFFMNKYNIPEHEYYIFDKETWTDIIIFNKLNQEEINKQLFQNFYNLLDEKPDWYKLWYFDNLNQDQFDECIRNIVSNLNNKKYTKIGEIKHISGLFFFFRNRNLLDINNFEKLILDNVGAIFENRENFQSYLNEKKYIFDESWASHSFYEIKDSAVQEIFEKIKEMCNKQRIENCKEDAPSILELLKSKELEKFSEDLTTKDNSKGRFWNDPILNEIDAYTFALAIIELDKNQIISLISTLCMRYEVSRDVYDVERDWLLKVIENIEKVILPSKTGILTLKISERILPSLSSIKEEMDFRHGFKISSSEDLTQSA